MRERGKVNVLMDQEKMRGHLFENTEGLEKAKFHLDIIDYVLEERRDLDQLSQLQEMLGKVGNDHVRGVIEEFAGDVDIQWYLLKSNVDEVRRCLDALGEKNKAFGVPRQDVRREA